MPVQPQALCGGELGGEAARLQAVGRVAKNRGKYEFAWLAEADGLVEQGVKPWMCLSCTAIPLEPLRSQSRRIFTDERPCVRVGKYVTALSATLKVRGRVGSVERAQPGQQRQHPTRHAELLVRTARSRAQVDPKR